MDVLVFRAFRMCSSYLNFHRKITRIKDILCKNRFSKALVDCMIRSFLNKKFESKDTGVENNNHNNENENT